MAITIVCSMLYRRDPYARSKKAIDLTAVQLNKELSGKVCAYSYIGLNMWLNLFAHTHTHTQIKLYFLP